MSNKIKLGNTPKTFKRTVEIVTINGAVDTLEITYKYRTRSQYAQLVDEQIAAAKADQARLAAAPADAPDQSDAQMESQAVVHSVAEQVAEQNAAGAADVLKVAEGWDLDDEFSVANLAQLEDENPGALFAITQAYRAAVVEVRAKN